jgi:hypothetical protein
VTGAYVRLRTLSAYDGDPWASLAELRVLGTLASGNQAPNGIIDSPSGDVTITVGSSVNFAGTASDPDGHLPLTYRWNFGAGSGIADATVQDPGSRQFNNIGTFTVTFTVTDSLGLSDPTPATRRITVQSSSSSGPIPQSGWSLRYVDSQELVGEDGAATNAFDGDPGSFWHTKWYGSSPPYPHEIQINLGATYRIEGFRALARQDGDDNGRIRQFEFYVSSDGVNWSSPVANGNLADSAYEQEVLFTPVTGSYVRLRPLSAYDGDPWASLAELSVLGGP